MSDIVVSHLDIETTGLKQEDGHRIIEIAAGVWRYNSVTKARTKVGRTWVQRINPMRDIDPGAQAVHKIAITDLRGMPLWEDVAAKLHKLLSMTHIMVAHNGYGFDAPFIAMELMRIGKKVPNFQVFDTMLEGRGCTAMGKVPNLAELCFAMGVDYDPDVAHAADYDVEVMEQAYWNGVDRGYFPEPERFLTT